MMRYYDYQNLKEKDINCYIKTKLKHELRQVNSVVGQLMRIRLMPSKTCRDLPEIYPLAFQVALFGKSSNKQIPYPSQNYVFFSHT